MNYKEKVLEYFKQRQKEGLKNVSFFVTDKIKELTEDSIYKELWRMINALTLPDKEILGKYSI